MEILEEDMTLLRVALRQAQMEGVVIHPRLHYHLNQYEKTLNLPWRRQDMLFSPSDVVDDDLQGKV